MKRLLIFALVCAIPSLNAMNQEQMEFNEVLKNLRKLKKGENIIDDYNTNYAKGKSLIESNPTLNKKQNRMLLEGAYSEGLSAALPSILETQKSKLEKMASEKIGGIDYYRNDNPQLLVFLTKPDGLSWYDNNQEKFKQYIASVVKNIHELTDILSKIRPFRTELGNINFKDSLDAYQAVLKKYYDPKTFSNAANRVEGARVARKEGAPDKITKYKALQEDLEKSGKAISDAQSRLREIMKSRNLVK